MCAVEKEVVLNMSGTEYDGNRAMIIEKQEMGFMKVQILELENFGKVLTITKYQLKD